MLLKPPGFYCKPSTKHPLIVKADNNTPFAPFSLNMRGMKRLIRMLHQSNDRRSVLRASNADGCMAFMNLFIIHLPRNLGRLTNTMTKPGQSLRAKSTTYL